MKEKLEQIRQAAVAELSRALVISPIISKLLYNRGYTTPSDARKFICMDLSSFFIVSRFFVNSRYALSVWLRYNVFACSIKDGVC